MRADFINVHDHTLQNILIYIAWHYLEITWMLRTDVTYICVIALESDPSLKTSMPRQASSANTGDACSCALHGSELVCTAESTASEHPWRCLVPKSWGQREGAELLLQ